MKVIKNNYKPEDYQVDTRLGYHKCPYCSSIIKIEKDDIKLHQSFFECGPEYEEPYDYVVCPCCSREIFMPKITDSFKSKKEFVKEQELFKESNNIKEEQEDLSTSTKKLLDDLKELAEKGYISDIFKGN